MKFGMYTLCVDRIPKISYIFRISRFFPDFPPDNPNFQFYGDFRA